MKDIYLMNKETGEILPSAQAIHEYYKTHGALEAWTDEWQETNLAVEGSTIPAPDFTNVFK